MRFYLDEQKEQNLIAKVRALVRDDPRVCKDNEFSRKINAILQHRTLTGSDLVTAKHWVETNPVVYEAF
jgi:ribosomal protein L7/L12